MISPVTEPQASDTVKLIYKDLKTALHVRSVPLFFTYMGAFPDYLTFISDQLKNNLQDPAFIRLTTSTGAEISELITTELPLEPNISEWQHRYGASSSYFHFKNQVREIHATNIVLAFIFVALREAVKGWAIAAKKLNPHAESGNAQTSHDVGVESFIFEQIEHDESTHTHRAGMSQSPATVSRGSLAKRPRSAIEEQLLPKYMDMCKIGFYARMKTVEFWQLRVATEKIVLAVLPLMPHVIFSPINVVIDLAKKHDNFPDLLYLLSEHFPTYAVQRMMFSGYMMRS